jgi:hypothetical protein
MASTMIPFRSPSEQHEPASPGSAEVHSRRTMLARLATGAAVADIPAGELGMRYYISSCHDPHLALKASLAGEPVPLAPDNDDE